MWMIFRCSSLELPLLLPNKSAIEYDPLRGQSICLCPCFLIRIKWEKTAIGVFGS